MNNQNRQTIPLIKRLNLIFIGMIIPFLMINVLDSFDSAFAVRRIESSKNRIESSDSLVREIKIYIPSINMVMMILTAYPLSKTKSEFGARNVLSRFFVFTMMFGGGLIPTYLVLMKLRLLNKIWVLVFPGALHVNNMILLMNFFRSAPHEIEEAAMIEESVRNHGELLAMLNARTGRAAQLFIAMIPIMIVYPLLSRYFTTGLVMGSVKG